MRIKINFTKNTQLIPFDKIHTLSVSYFHKCIGNNNIHDKPSDYNLSPLMGGKLVDGMLNFDNGGFIILSSIDAEIICKMMIGVNKNKELGYGMTFEGIEDRNISYHIGRDDKPTWHNLGTLSPILLSKSIDNKKRKFFTLNNKEEYINNLTIRTINKLKKINSDLDLSDFKIEIPDNNSHKVKKIMIHNVNNFANQHHLNIFCKSDVAELLCNIGLGQSTGCGFGTLYMLNDKDFYVKKT